MTREPMESPPAKPGNNLAANPEDAETQPGGLPCQRWARRCLLGRERDLAAELRALYRARQESSGQDGPPADSVDNALRRVIAALTAVQTVLSQWPSVCASCPAPVELLSPGNVARCQVLRAVFLPDTATRQTLPDI